jgi:hypothetical protein
MSGHQPQDLECAVAGGRPNALRSLARSRGVDFHTVLMAAERGELKRIVEMRSHKTLSPGRPGMGAKDGWQALTVLSFKPGAAVSLICGFGRLAGLFAD